MINEGHILICWTEAQLIESKTIKRSLDEKKIEFSKYFLSTKLSDVSIRCETETFPAHILILSSEFLQYQYILVYIPNFAEFLSNWICDFCSFSDNSPVFAKMFEYDMKESMEKLVEIKNAEAVVVLEMLRYFYTGEVEFWRNHMGTKLYKLADRYLVDKLKVFCVRTLIQHLHKNNALEMFCFGGEWKIPDLKKSAGQVLLT